MVSYQLANCYDNSGMSFSRVYCIYLSEGRAPSPSPFSCLASLLVGAKSPRYWLNSGMEAFSADHRSQHAPSKDACSLRYVAAGARALCKSGLTWLLTLVGAKHWLLWDWLKFFLFNFDFHGTAKLFHRASLEPYDLGLEQREKWELTLKRAVPTSVLV